jgi:hypothetical protein
MAINRIRKLILIIIPEIAVLFFSDLNPLKPKTIPKIEVASGTIIVKIEKYETNPSINDIIARCLLLKR